jgi:hypothetical protein
VIELSIVVAAKWNGRSWMHRIDIPEKHVEAMADQNCLPQAVVDAALTALGIVDQAVGQALNDEEQ